MKLTMQLFALGLAAALGFTATNARADLEFSAAVTIHAKADFYSPLTTCGTWVEVGSYGRCWRPAGVVVGWRPYCDGYWVWTDCGWFWVSDEPWAWACYHYGYWVDDSYYGWVWIPDIVWAPAWVSWRIGGGCIGWAPNPPPGAFFTRRAPASTFVFVGAERFGEPIKPSVLIANNAGIIKQTKFVTNEKRLSRDFDGTGARVGVFNEGPGLAAIQNASGRQFKPVAISEAVHRTQAPPEFVHKTAQPEKRETKQEQKPVAASDQKQSSPSSPPPQPGNPHQGAPSGGDRPSREQGQGHDRWDNQDGQGSGGGRGHDF